MTLSSILVLTHLSNSSHCLQIDYNHKFHCCGDSIQKEVGRTMMQVENGKTLRLVWHLGTICLVTPIMAFGVAKHIVPM